MFSNRRRSTVTVALRIGVVFVLILPGFQPRSHPIPAAAAHINAAASTVQLSSSAYRADESAGTLTIPVSLDAISAQPVTVSFATSNGSAEAGSDYTSAAGQLTFPAAITDGYILNARDFTGLRVTADPNDRHYAFTWRGGGSEAETYANASGAVTSVTTDIYPEISTLAQAPANTYEVWILQFGGDGDRSLEVKVGDNTPVHTDSGNSTLWLHVGAYAMQPDTIIKVKAVGAFVNHGQDYPERRGAFTAIYLTTQAASITPSFVADGQTSCPVVNAGLTVTCPALTTQSIAIGITDDALVEAYETFTISLSAPQNATLGAPSSATVTIVGPSNLTFLPQVAKGTAP